MLKRFFDKSEIWFAVASIAVYCILMSAGDALSETVGLYKSVTLVFGVLLSAILLVFLKKNLRSVIRTFLFLVFIRGTVHF